MDQALAGIGDPRLFGARPVVLQLHGLLHRHVRCRRARPLAAQTIDRGIARQSQEPGQNASTLERVQVAIDLDEDLLSQVAGFFAISQIVERDGVNATLETAH